VEWITQHPTLQLEELMENTPNSYACAVGCEKRDGGNQQYPRTSTQQEATVMPYANNQGIRIHYEVEGKGPPLLLQHGATGSLEDWRDIGHVEALEDDFRLVIVDARGHGGSDKPHDPAAYTMRLMASDVVAVLDDLSIERAHYWGYSMGAMMGWWEAIYAPERFRSLILGGRTPYGEVLSATTPEEAAQVRKEFESAVAAPEKGLGEWATSFPALTERTRKNDVEALVAWRMANMPSRRVYHPNALKEILPWLEMPCPTLIYMGQVDIDEIGLDDNYLNCVKNMLNVTFIGLPNLDHTDAMFRDDLVLPHVRRFLAEVGEG
jgi:pimeloyl-ACP methyl ester carboxylesterase